MNSNTDPNNKGLKFSDPDSDPNPPEYHESKKSLLTC